MKSIYFIALLTLFINCDSIEQPEEVVINTETIDPTTTSIYIDKSDYKLSLLVNGETVKTYPIVFGFNAVEDKRRQGDGCTPEGHFKVRTQYPHKSWSKFIWIDYPNNDSWEKHNRSKANGEIPGDATIGGEIGIHGTPKGADYVIDEKINWTHGCISMKRADVDELYKCVQKGTPIEIVK